MMKRTTLLAAAACALCVPAWSQTPPADEKAKPAEAPKAAPKPTIRVAPKAEVKPPPPPDFGWFGDLVGSCWTGRMPDGKTEHTQCYTKQYDRFIRGTATLSIEREGKWRAVFAGDSLFAGEPSGQRLSYYIWGTDGQHRALEANYFGDGELVFPMPSRDDPSKIAFRSVWKRVDKDRFEVRRERPVSEKWVPELTVMYARVPPDKLPGAKKDQ